MSAHKYNILKHTWKLHNVYYFVKNVVFCINSFAVNNYFLLAQLIVMDTFNNSWDRN